MSRAMLWRRLRGGGRVLVVLPLVEVPLLHAGALQLPDDSCSPEAPRTQSASACRTTPGG